MVEKDPSESQATATAGPTGNPSTTPSRRRSGRLRLVLPTLGIVFVVATFAYFLPQIADYRDVWSEVRELSWAWLAALAGAVLLNVATFAPPWMVALPGLGFRRSLVLTQASTALTIVVPGGAAIGIAGSYGMLHSWRFPAASIARAVTLTGIWNQLANLAFPIVALFGLSVTGARTAALTTVAFIGVGVFGAALAALAAVFYSDRLAEDVGELVIGLVNGALRLLHRRPVSWRPGGLVHFRQGAVALLRRRWHALTAATLVGNLTVFLVLFLCLRAFGVEAGAVSGAEAFAAWSLVRIIGALPLTPGGVGIIELGLAGSLVAFGGPNANVVAAVLAYRFLTVAPTLVLGLLAAATWRRHRPRPALP